jgi:hypothetical protein
MHQWPMGKDEQQQQQLMIDDQLGRTIIARKIEIKLIR